jgi:hypothetical protein
MSLFMINAILALVNLIPIPPLDGSKIWPCIIPGMRPVVKSRMSQVWLVVLVVALYTGAIGKVLTPGINFLAGLAYSAMDHTETYTERPDNFPDSLVAPDNAAGTIYKISPARKDGGEGYGLYYRLEEPYPCDSLIAGITVSLAEQGWHKTVYALDNRNELSSDQWVTLEDKQGQFIQWTGTWINELSEWIFLDVYYEVEPGTETPSTAHVSMYQNTGTIVELYRTLHPNEMPVID